MPTTSQLWFITKKAALVIGVLAIAHAVGAPRTCGGCGVKAGKSQASSNPNPGETTAAGGGAWGPGTQSLPYIEKKKKNSGNTKGSEQGVIAIIKPGETTAAGGGAWGPGTTQSYGTGVYKPGTNLRIDTPRVSPGGVGGGAGGGARVR
jgi:hypothetical protein